MISATGCEGGSVVMGLSPGECSRSGGPGSCAGSELGGLAGAGLALGCVGIGPGISCAAAGSARKRAAAPRRINGFRHIVLMALESFKAILHTLLLLLQYRILTGPHGLHGRLLHRGKLCNPCALNDPHWIEEVARASGFEAECADSHRR